MYRLRAAKVAATTTQAERFWRARLDLVLTPASHSNRALVGDLASSGAGRMLGFRASEGRYGYRTDARGPARARLIAVDFRHWNVTHTCASRWIPVSVSNLEHASSMISTGLPAATELTQRRAISSAPGRKAHGGHVPHLQRARDKDKWFAPTRYEISAMALSSGWPSLSRYR